MKALVTGGGGFLGKAICTLLQQRGDMVWSLSRSRHPGLAEIGITHIQGDICDPEDISRAVHGMDIVFHVAARAGVWGDEKEFYRVNVTGTENIISACIKHAVRKLVFTSSPSVIFNGMDMEGVDESVPYPDDYPAAYPRTKALAEQLVRDADSSRLATVSLRPHLIWGPGDNHLIPRIIARGKAGQLRRIGKASKLTDSVYIENAALAHILAADRLEFGSRICGRVYFITNNEPVPVWELINRILEAADLPPVTKHIPLSLARWIASVSETIYKLARIRSEPRLTRFVISELSTSHWFDISAAQKDLGYTPRVSITRGMVKLREYFQLLGSPPEFDGIHFPK